MLLWNAGRGPRRPSSLLSCGLETLLAAHYLTTFCNSVFHGPIPLAFPSSKIAAIAPRRVTRSLLEPLPVSPFHFGLALTFFLAAPIIRPCLVPTPFAG
jgi:hypothetical protein